MACSMTKFPFWSPPRRENPSDQYQQFYKTFLRSPRRFFAGCERANRSPKSAARFLFMI
jgi:hypothetical protein